MFEMSKPSIRNGGAGRPKIFASSTKSICGIDGQRQVYGTRANFSVFFHVSLQVADEVAQIGGFLKFVRGGGFFHLRFELRAAFPGTGLRENCTRPCTCSKYCSRLTLPTHGAVQYFRCA